MLIGRVRRARLEWRAFGLRRASHRKKERRCEREGGGLHGAPFISRAAATSQRFAVLALAEHLQRLKTDSANTPNMRLMPNSASCFATIAHASHLVLPRSPVNLSRRPDLPDSGIEVIGVRSRRTSSLSGQRDPAELGEVLEHLLERDVSLAGRLDPAGRRIEAVDDRQAVLPVAAYPIGAPRPIPGSRGSVRPVASGDHATRTRIG